MNLSPHDYFMAHAPAEPQPWFRPFMASKRPASEFVGNDCRSYASALEAERAVGEDGFTNLSAVEQAQWDEERKKQRYVQWPAAWAKEMLNARNA